VIAPLRYSVKAVIASWTSQSLLNRYICRDFRAFQPRFRADSRRTRRSPSAAINQPETRIYRIRGYALGLALQLEIDRNEIRPDIGKVREKFGGGDTQAEQEPEGQHP
jgi:hypothetical protein